MTTEIQPATRIAEGIRSRDLVREYLAHEIGQLRAVSGIELDVDELVSNTFDHVADYLPPAGIVLLAVDGDEGLLGCVFLKMIRADACEVKRLYVRPEARGRGLGRKLMESILAGARNLGAASILLDTGVYDTAAQALYRKLGLREIERYPEGENAPELRPDLVYMQLDL